MTLLIAVLALIDSSFKFYKAKIKRDLSLISSGIARLMLFFLSIIMLIVKIDYSINTFMFIGGIVIASVLITDLVSNIVYILNLKDADVQEKTRLIEALGLLQEKHYSILENSQAGIYTVNEKGQFEYVNPSFCDITGYRKDELLVMSFIDLVIPEMKQTMLENLDERIRGIVPYASYDLYIKNKQGEVVKLHLISYLSQNGHPTVTGNVIVVDEE